VGADAAASLHVHETPNVHADVNASSNSANTHGGVDATASLHVHETPNVHATARLRVYETPNVHADVNPSSNSANTHGGVEATARVQGTSNVHGEGASLAAPGGERRETSTSSTPTEQQPLLESAPVDAPAPASAACAARPEPLARAKQSIPPALRRAVLLRDKHRCQVPGCRNTTFLDLHHIQLRSEGGRHELGNMLTLCGCHHRATHRGSLLIEKDPGGGVVFRHGDGSVYGGAVQPQALGAQAKLFSALRHLGFKEREVRAVLADLRADPALRGVSLQDQLREALRRLHPPQPRP
jgi:hypothetical protein